MNCLQKTLIKPGSVFVLSGPSGVGKNTLAERICSKGLAVRAVTATTRAPRPGEVDGRDYYFVTEKQFGHWRETGILLEWNYYGGNWYGTPLFSVNEAVENCRAVLLVIDVNGALKLKKLYDPVTLVFIRPPSLNTLKVRLNKRGGEDEQSICRRIAIAEEEMEARKDYDHVIVNGDLEKAEEELENIIETHVKT